MNHTTDKELKDILVKYPGGMQLSVNPVAMRDLKSLLTEAKINYALSLKGKEVLNLMESTRINHGKRTTYKIR